MRPKPEQPSTPLQHVPTHSCPMCGQAFWARIGPTSHLRTHHQSSVEVMVIFDFRRTNDNKGPGYTTVQEGSDDKYCKANYKSEVVIPALNKHFSKTLSLSDRWLLPKGFFVLKNRLLPLISPGLKLLPKRFLRGLISEGAYNWTEKKHFKTWQAS